MPQVPRRTQAERSAAMRETLIAAATELLIERGWAATTAVAVCDRAGVTRGALAHHYPSLSALLADALEAIFADIASRNRSRPGPSTVVEVIDGLWRSIGDRRYKAVLEAWSAAGNDPELAAELQPTITRIAKLVAAGSDKADGPLSDPDTRTFVVVAREAMLGLALGRATNGGKPLGHEKVVLARLRADAAAIDARTT